MKTTFIGIDFGTTKTLVSCYNAVQRDVKIIRLGRGRDDLPTSIYAAEDGSFLCGEDAEDMCAMEPTRYARAFKMKLGSDDSVLAFFDAVSGDLVGHKASSLAVEYLRGIRAECSRLQGGEVVGAVITRPVRFSPIQCKQLEDAAYAAGFAELRFITEPEAAAHTFCRDNEGEGFRNALIIDWGGGTLDMALVSRQGEQLRTYSQYTDGLLIGGEGFDDALLRHVVEQLKAGGVDITPDLMNPEYSYTIRHKVRQAKEMLSKLPQVQLRLSGSGGAYPAVTVRREDFIELIRPHIEQAAVLARRLINSIAELSLKPEMMILVGGSSRIPAIAEMLEQQVGLPCRTWDMSMEAVGLGAAWMSSVPEKETPPAPQPAPQPAPAPKPQTPVAPAPMSGGDACERARALLFAANGEPDVARAMEIYHQAANAGDLAAAFELMGYYVDGEGVTRDYDVAVKTAERLMEYNYYPALWVLEMASRKGQGMPLDLQKADAYAEVLLSTCSQPISGVRDEDRFFALMLHESFKTEQDSRHEEELARAYVKCSSHPRRFATLAASLVKLAANGVKSQSMERECDRLLEQGVAAGDQLAHMVCGIRQLTNGDVEGARASFYRMSQRGEGLDRAWWLLALMADSEASFNEAIEHFWLSCNYGISGIVPKRECSCLISLRKNDVGGIANVYPKELLKQIISQGQGGLYAPCLPILQIRNTGVRPICNPSIRICCAKTEVDVTFSLVDALGNSAVPGASTIAPGEMREVNLHQIPVPLSLEGEIYVEVQSELGKSCMTLASDEGVADFLTSAPFAMWWERGLFGGIVLNIVNLEDSPMDLQVRKLTNGALANVVLSVSDIQGNDLDGIGVNAATVGWLEFTDSAGLKEGESFTVTAAAVDNAGASYPPIVGEICTSLRA